MTVILLVLAILNLCGTGYVVYVLRAIMNRGLVNPSQRDTIARIASGGGVKVPRR